PREICKTKATPTIHPTARRDNMQTRERISGATASRLCLFARVRGRRQQVRLRRCARAEMRPLFSAMKWLVLLASVLLLTSGGTAVSARKVIALDGFQHIFVEQEQNDNHHVDEEFVAELRKMGRDATSGPLTMMPENADAVLTYDARWEWDVRTYLIELTVELHTAR